MDAVFLSDVHLKSLNERNGQTLLRFFSFLESQPGTPPTIFLLGDIFDLWVSDHRVFIKRYQPLIDILQRLQLRGAKVIYFEGNHDMHLAPFWEDVLGAEVHVRAESFKIGGVVIRCEHGDEMNLEDLAYIRLRKTLRHPFMEQLAHKLPGFLWDQIGQRWSATSRKYSSREDRAERIRQTIRDHAVRVAAQENFDVLISGHMHVMDDWEFTSGGRKVRSINLGSWLQDPPQVLCLEAGQFSWRTP